MLSPSNLRNVLRQVLAAKHDQGHDTARAADELTGVPESLDALVAFARRAAVLPMRDGWEYVEPTDWDLMQEEMSPDRPTARLGVPTDLPGRIREAFLARVAGCVLGKPLEISPTLAEIRAASEPRGEWPLRDYVTKAVAQGFTRSPHESWPNTVRENIRFVEPDDDIMYTVLGMLLIEQHGHHWGKAHLRDKWLRHLTPKTTFGPERLALSLFAWSSLWEVPLDLDDVLRLFNPKEEFCGALIRVDPYAYAAAGHPALAAEYAWRDATLTHRRTGVYGAVWTAALLATVGLGVDWREAAEVALKFVPRRSRFYAIVSDSMLQVAQANDWLDGYGRIHGRYGEFGHCRVLQECGTLLNTLRFAKSAGDAICMQVMQGNDTDSFGATAGSMAGMRFGPGSLDARWLAPFNDDLHTALAWYFERSLEKTAARMSALPARLGT